VTEVRSPQLLVVHVYANAYLEPMPLEECGNMIIMALAYAQRASDTAYLSKHYAILKQWTGYLIAEALIPADQLSTDDFQGTLANQTNLALKGIIAIEAMSVVAKLTGNTADAENFTTTSHSYLTQWQSLAIVNATASAPAHTKLAYQDATGHGLLYNLYADKLLNLNFVPQHIYDMQSTYYPTVAHTYGVPLDSRNVATKCKSSSTLPYITLHSSPLTISNTELTFPTSRLGNVGRSHLFSLHKSNVHLQTRNLDCQYTYRPRLLRFAEHRYWRLLVWPVHR
jgi:hypothetical protein